MPLTVHGERLFDFIASRSIRLSMYRYSELRHEEINILLPVDWAQLNTKGRRCCLMITRKKKFLIFHSIVIGFLMVIMLETIHVNNNVKIIRIVKITKLIMSGVYCMSRDRIIFPCIS
jgi:hypothetical protein